MRLHFGSLFAPGTTINERCSCGSTFHASGAFATSAALQWRMDHACPNRATRDPRPARDERGLT